MENECKGIFCVAPVTRGYCSSCREAMKLRSQRTTLRRELAEAKAEHQDAELSDAFDVLRREHQTALVCCNAFLDANRGEDIAPLFVLMSTQDHDHITRLALNVTGREK